MTSLITTIETDLKAAWGAIEGAVENAAKEVWDDFKVSFTALLPEEYTIVKTAIVGVLEGAADKSIEEIETALLNAGGQELALIEKLGSEVVQALISVVKVSGSTEAA